MLKRYRAWVVITLASLGLIVALAVTGTPVSARPAPTQVYLYLPLVAKQLIPTANPLHFIVHVGPDCQFGPPAYDGPSPAVVGRPVTKIHVDTDIYNAANKSLNWHWTLDGSTFDDQSGPIPNDSYFTSSVEETSFSETCDGELGAGTFLIQLYVDGQLLQSGTVTAQ